MKRFELLFTKLIPYGLAFAAIFAIMHFGSQTTEDAVKAPIVRAFEDTSFNITTDQVSEAYTVANIANAISIPSTSSISENYVTVTELYETANVANTSSNQVIEKPNIIDTSNLISGGVIQYVVKSGDTIESALKNAGISTGVTSTQVRWSNGLKTTKLTAGKTIYLPTVPGIVYKVKNGDTIDSLVKKYGANKEKMIAYNDLELSDKLTAGSLILLPDGTLPEKERPEYVAPVRRSRPSYSYTYTYTYVNEVGIRHGMREIGSYNYWASEYRRTKYQNNPGAFGNCTWYAWYWRRNNMPKNYWLPSGTIGNARNWVYTLGGKFKTGRTPAYGAVMQSTGGAYGHVAVVVGVNPGKSITIQEMNFAGPNGKYNHVYQSTIYWKDALKFNYIYERR